MVSSVRNPKTIRHSLGVKVRRPEKVLVALAAMLPA